MVMQDQKTSPDSEYFCKILKVRLTLPFKCTTAKGGGDLVVQSYF